MMKIAVLGIVAQSVVAMDTIKLSAFNIPEGSATVSGISR